MILRNWYNGFSKIQEVVVVNKIMKILGGKGIFFKNILKVLERKKKILFLFYQKQQKFRKINISLLFFLYFVTNPRQNVRDQSIEINVKRFVAVSLKRDTQF